MIKNLYILGYCEEMIPILTEIALDCGYQSPFQIIKNMKLEKGRYRIDVPGVNFEYVWKTDWVTTGKEMVSFSVVKPASKQKVFQEFQEFFKFQREHYPDLIHPSCFVSRTAKTSGGLIMEPLSVISSHTRIGFGVNIRRGVNIGHHNNIGDFVSIYPGANIAGKVLIGNRVTIGIGAVILDEIEIGEGSFIGAGSVVTRSIPPGTVAFGNPCKVIREIES